MRQMVVRVALWVVVAAVGFAIFNADTIVADRLPPWAAAWAPFVSAMLVAVPIAVLAQRRRMAAMSRADAERIIVLLTQIKDQRAAQAQTEQARA